MDQTQIDAVVRRCTAQAQEKLKKARQAEGGPTLARLAEVRRLLDQAIRAMEQDTEDRLTGYKDNW
jgi:hypothetical protein